PHDDAPDNDVAVVGMALRVPGAVTPDAYWQNLRDGVESITHWSVEELEGEGVDPELLRDPRYVRSSGVLDDVAGFDAGFFGVSAKDAGIMDPQHRLFLECAWEALEDAGHTAASFPGSIAVYAGCGMNGYFIHNLLTNPDLVKSVGMFLLRHTSNDKDFLSTFVSYKMDLKGPSVNVQTACSTSLVAIHGACQSLLNGECDMALAGGSTINVPHRTGYLYQEGEILSPDGHCRAFDAQAAGTVFGNGSGAVVLRRLQDAIEDGDPIHAVIRGSAINNDGSQKAGYLAPSVEGQAQAIAEAISVAGVAADEVAYVEAHGTGTAVGDPIEVAALTQAFRQSTDRKGFCGLGSVKPNIGHLDTAAGVASFIKVVQALKHRELPPSISFERPSPAIDFDTSPFYVNATLRPWESDGPRVAGVSSLGVGGTNAHAILEEAPPREPSGPGRAVQLLTLSARTPTALDAASERLAAHLRAHPDEDLCDVAWTLQAGRKAFEHRRTVVCRSIEEAAARLETPDKKSVSTGKVAGPSVSTAFMFPGGGAQYPRMAAGLHESEPVFRKHLDRALGVLADRWQLDLRDTLFATDDLEAAAARFEAPGTQLPAIFAVEYALARLWMSWGLRPNALIGHSMGENTAACLAGVISLEDALGLVTLRGRLFERTKAGGMISLAVPADEIGPYLSDDCVLASVNAPSLCVVSGPVEAIDGLEARLAEEGVDHHRVKIAVAAHSPLLEPILEEFGDYLRSVTLSRPEIPIVSNRTGTWLTDEQATNPDYWVQHLRHTVHFADGIGTLLETPGRVLLEVGPGKTLGSLSRQHASVQPGQAILSTLRHPDEHVDDAEFIQGALGRLWNAGVAFDWEEFHAGEDRQRVSLPTYPFERQRYWIEPGRARYESAERERPIERLDSLDDWFRRPVWHTAAPPDQAATADAPARWLLFVDAAGVGSELARRLRAGGHEVVEVREGDAFYRFSETEYALAPEAGRDGYDALVKD
ncbi:MAG: type I polyketide synthase, partial [Myxococcales bacterium]|nr:type I polyketide synthase [Myxococcales bacterium]